jgi:predicted nuclease of predicted toxin-antitoxin system
VEVLHVRDINLDESPDTSIWRYARQHGYDVLTKDEDFVRLVLAEGFPPRVVAVQNAQVPVKQLAKLLLARLPQLEAFLGEQPSLECCSYDCESRMLIWGSARRHAQCASCSCRRSLRRMLAGSRWVASYVATRRASRGVP